MSMMGTLAKVAIGMAIAKGVGSMMNNRGGSDEYEQGQQGGGLGGMLGQLTGGAGGAGGGLGGMLGQLTGGAGSAAGGLGGMLGQLTGGAGGSGGLGGMLGQLASGAQGGGGLGGLLAGLAGGAVSGAGANAFGDMFNNALANGGEPEEEPDTDQEAAAALMLRAMIQAAKADGEIDESEQQKISEFLADLNEEDREFVVSELQTPVDIDGLVQDVPEGLEQPVYTMSIIGIELDHMDEAQYLRDFAEALGLGEGEVNAIHDKLGVPHIYS